MFKKPTQTSTRWLIIVNPTLASLRRPWDSPPSHHSQQCLTNKENARSSFPTSVKQYGAFAHFHFLFLLMVKFWGLCYFWHTLSGASFYYYKDKDESDLWTHQKLYMKLKINWLHASHLFIFYFENILQKFTCKSTHYRETPARLRVKQELAEQGTFFLCYYCYKGQNQWH